MTNPENLTPPVNSNDETGDPDALDTGDYTEVPPEQRVDHDDDPPNQDADADLSHVSEGEVVNLEDTEDDDDDDEAEENTASASGNPPATSGPPAQGDEQGPSSTGG